MQTHEELHAQTLDAARKEKFATLELLRFLKKIEERRTFAVLGYPSLFKYVEEGLGYSPAQASERVSAMRLLRQVPAVAERLQDGGHTLTSIAKIASHARRENLAPAQASALVLETANQTIGNLEKHLAGIAQVEPPKLERAKIISRELTRLTLDVEDEFMAQVQRMKELKGNPSLSLSEVFASAMGEFIKRREPKTEMKPSGTSVTEVKRGAKSEEEPARALEMDLPRSKAESAKPGALPRSRYIRARDRNRTRIRSGECCEYVHEASGRRCASRTGLQFEHVVPFAKGGANDERNLKRLCPAHNRLRAIQEYGEKKMRPFLRA